MSNDIRPGSTIEYELPGMEYTVKMTIPRDAINVSLLPNDRCWCGAKASMNGKGCRADVAHRAEGPRGSLK